MDAHRHGAKGFTLTELLITLAIIGIVTMAGAPALGALVARTQDATAEAALAGTLRQARTAAVTHATRVLVCPSRDGRRCDAGDDWQHGWIVAEDADHDAQPDARRPVLAVQSALATGTRITTSAGRKQLAFQPSGSAGGSNASFTICHVRARDGRAVIVANSGRVRVAPVDPARLQACLAQAR